MLNTARLLHLADELERDAKNPMGIKFDLTLWIKSGGTAPKIDCGTTACAVGLACLLPEFQAEGLSFDFDKRCPKFKGLYGWEAVTEFFGLDDTYDSEWLFNEDHYDYAETRGAKGERAVAARIREHVAESIAA